jgi:hypothetical protein
MPSTAELCRPPGSTIVPTISARFVPFVTQVKKQKKKEEEEEGRKKKKICPSLTTSRGS